MPIVKPVPGETFNPHNKITDTVFPALIRQFKQLVSPSSEIVDPSPDKVSQFIASRDAPKTREEFFARGLDKQFPNAVPYLPKATPTLTPRPAAQANTSADAIVNQVFGKEANNANRVLDGENARRQFVLDVPNRIDPKTGKWDDNAPVMMRKNPMNGELIPSIDRGLFRINNITFFDYLKRKPQVLAQYGITSWDDMNDPMKNAYMAKILKDDRGWGQWYASPADLK